MSNKVTKAELAEFEKNKDKVKAYSNADLTVYWRADLCIHSANCIIDLPEVFSTGKKPWVNMNGDTSKSIMQTVDTCPSRALVYLSKEEPVVKKPRKKAKRKTNTVHVQVLKNGPLLITGNFIIRDASKKKVIVKGERAALCRCGGTRKPPLCDGTHLAMGFEG